MKTPLRTIAVCLLTAAMLAPATIAQTRKTTRKPPASPPPNEQAAWPIESLTVEGNHIWPSAKILAVAGMRSGRTATKAEFETEFEAARQRLVATGFFDSVGYHFAPARDGKGYAAAFQVSEVGQIFPLQFEDLPATDAELRALIAQKDPLYGPKTPATKPVLDRYTQWIGEFLAAKNFHEPLTARLSSENPPELVILIRPSKPRPTIAQVQFTNSGEIPPQELQAVMYGVAVGTTYSEGRVRVLLDASIRPLYEARGHMRVAFPKIEAEKAKEVEGFNITVEVMEGPVYKLGKATYEGTLLRASDLTKMVKLKSAEVVNFDEVKAGQGRIDERLKHEGYLESVTRVDRAVNDTGHSIDVKFRTDPGPQYTFGKLTILGLDITSEPVIRKMWGLEAGKPFNPTYPEHFLGRIKEEGLFDNLKTTRSENKIDRGSHVVDVTVYFNQ
jgi:outer membrane protein insertion porin family